MIDDWIQEEDSDDSSSNYGEVIEEGYTEHELMSDLSVPNKVHIVGVRHDVVNDVKVTSWVQTLINCGGYYIWSPQTGAIMWYSSWSAAKAAVDRAPMGAVVVTVRDDKAYTYGKRDVGYSSAGTGDIRSWVQAQVDEYNRQTQAITPPPSPAPPSEEPHSVEDSQEEQIVQQPDNGDGIDQSTSTSTESPEEEEEEESDTSDSDSDSGSSDDEEEDDSRTESSVDSDYLSGDTGATDYDNDGYDDYTGEGLGYEDVPEELSTDDLDSLF